MSCCIRRLSHILTLSKSYQQVTLHLVNIWCVQNWSRCHSFASSNHFQPGRYARLEISRFMCFTNQTPHSVEVSVLLSELGFSTVAKGQRRQTAQRNQDQIVENINLLHELGVNNEIIKQCEGKQKGFLQSSSMNLHVEFLQSIHLSNEDISNIMQRVPRFFMSSPSVVQDIVNYMVNVGVSNKNIRNLIIFSPSLFYRVKGRPQQIGNYLLTVIQKHQPNADVISILPHMLRNDVKLFSRTVNEVSRNLKFLSELGFEGENLVKIIRYCPSALRIGTDFLQRRWDYLKERLVLNDKEVILFVTKYPRILTLADEKIEDIFDFLFEKAGFQLQNIVKNPRLFERSRPHLEERLQILLEVKYKGDFIPMLTVWGKVFDQRIAKLKQMSDIKDRTD